MAANKAFSEQSKQKVAPYLQIFNHSQFTKVQTSKTRTI